MQPAGRDVGGMGDGGLVGAHDEEDAVNAMLMASSGEIVQQRGKWREHENETVQGVHIVKYMQWHCSEEFLLLAAET
jgi:hypothetical protein